MYKCFRLDTVRGSRVALGAATPAIFTVLFLFILPQVGFNIQFISLCT